MVYDQPISFLKKIYLLARGQLADVDNIISLLHLRILVRSVKGRAGKRHKTSPSRLQDAKWCDELEEGIYPRGLRGAKRELVADRD